MTLHIIPQNDLEEHLANLHCKCLANRYQEILTDWPEDYIEVHNAFDKREFRERVTNKGEPGKAWEVVRE